MREDIFQAAEVWHPDDKVFLKSQWGWEPAEWGFLAFSKKTRRDNVAKSHPKPFIGLIYSTQRVRPGREDQSLKICGFYVVSNEHVARADYALTAQGPDPHADRWLFGLKPLSAFSFLPDVRPLAREIFPEFSEKNTWRSIGSLGRPLKCEDNRLIKLRELPVTEAALFKPWEGSLPVDIQPRACLPWTKAGPQRETGYWVEPPDPNLRRSLYIMRLHGEEANFLLDPPGDRWIVKVGLSCDPNRRLSALAGMMPQGKYCWATVYPETKPTTALPYNFKAAVAGEDAMKRYLGTTPSNHLGGEFYAATQEQIVEAWNLGNKAAKAVQEAVST